MASDTVDENVKYRYSKTDTGDETNRLEARYPKNKRMTLDERGAQIPTDAGKYAPVSGEKINSTEAGRNVRNTLNALAPIGGGVGKVGAELATAGRAQRAYNAAQAERRAAEGFSPAEALRRKQLIEEAAAAGGLKKGGAVKKMASGGVTKSAKPAAKGWGQARGARGAKYY